MQRLSDISQQLAAAVVCADPDDLQQLAAMHSNFQLIAQTLDELTADQQMGLNGLREVANSAEAVVEQIILRESENAVDELNRIGRAVMDMQAMIDRALDPSQAKANSIEPVAATAPQYDLSAAQLAETFSFDQSASSDVRAEETSQAPAVGPAAIVETTLVADDYPLALEFVAEATGHIESAETSILALEDDPHNLETINAIFRAFHTIKGVAGFLNLKQIGSLAHAGENLLDLARQQKLTLVGRRVDRILEAIDLTKSMLTAIEQAARTGCPVAVEPRLPAMIDALHDCIGDDSSPSPSTQSPAENPAQSSAVNEAAAEISNPPPEATSVVAAASNIKAAGTPQSSNASDQTIKVATDRLDSLINMVGELVIAQTMVQADIGHLAAGSQRAARNLGHMGKITRELQDLSMSMRMVPIQGVFQKMARLVRDTARKIGKEIELTMTGAETELDRNVVEAIADPLVHMVRNSLDHGVEMPEDRVKAGKNRIGQVGLKAFHQAGNIVIEISDDGRGLNKQKILAKAIANGLVKEGAQLSDGEIFRLIFAAGLSTAEKVTDISGRGVGMDVVRKNVEALRGRIDIASSEGKGSTFAIRLPLTLAVIDGLVVKVGEQRYIIPITSIEQSIQPRPQQVSMIQGRGEAVLVRGNLLRLLRLHRVFKVAPKYENPTDALVVIVQNDRHRCCLLVDELLGQQQVVIKSLGDGMGVVKGISGGAILGDGNVSLILDVPGLLELSESDDPHAIDKANVQTPAISEAA